MSRAVLAFGSNLGRREGSLSVAAKAVAALPGTKVLDTSFLYETAPVGFTDQPRFLNAAAVIETRLSPHALLGACLGIEAAMGRVRSFKNGPRVVDIDLLVYEGETSADEELTLPHPRLGERAFVLVPLHDLFPDGRILDRDFSAEMAAAMAQAEVSGVAERKKCRL